MSLMRRAGRRRQVAVAAVATVVLLMAAAAVGAPGGFDTGFGGQGYQTVGFGGMDRATHVAVTPDGRIVLVGTTNAAGSNDWAITRLKAGQASLKLRTGAARVSSALGTHRKVMSGLGSIEFTATLRSAGLDRLADRASALASAAKKARVAVNTNQKPLFPRGRSVAVTLSAIAHTLGIEGF